MVTGGLNYDTCKSMSVSATHTRNVTNSLTHVDNKLTYTVGYTSARKCTSIETERFNLIHEPQWTVTLELAFVKSMVSPGKLTISGRLGMRTMV